MKNLLATIIKDKRILILGFGREGRKTLELILKVSGFKSVTVSDKNDVSKDLPESVLLIWGENYLDILDDYDVCFKSPGVVLPKAEKDYKVLITSETEVFINAYKDKIIGITGTKGKSTTSSLMYHVFKEAGKDVLFAGNIGIPVFEICDDVKDDTIIVLELSCHQLEYAKTSPKTGVILNIFEDHLDHYGTREKYAKAKLNLCLNKLPSDELYTVKEVAYEFKLPMENVHLIDKAILPINDFSEISGIMLRGQHNLLNAAFVYAITKRYGVSDESFINALSTFKTLPHRLEFAGRFDGIDYYDDSISTTVRSAISAIESIDNAETILIGGMERNIDYTELVSYLLFSRIKNIVCMYESGERFFGLIEAEKEKSGSKVNVVLVKDLEEAVKASKKITIKKGAVILSPASASYGYFKNFEERGDVFKKLVKC